MSAKVKFGAAFPTVPVAAATDNDDEQSGKRLPARAITTSVLRDGGTIKPLLTQNCSFGPTCESRMHSHRASESRILSGASTEVMTIATCPATGHPVERVETVVDTAA